MTVINLNGPEGNAFALIGIARKLAKANGLDGEAIMEDMMSGDYDHLLKVLVKHFEDEIVLIG